MKYLKRCLYLLYYIRESDYKQLKTFARYSSSVTGKTVFSIIFDSLISVFKYNISLKDYFSFRFFEIKDDQRRKWAGTGFMYEYQLKMNPKKSRSVLEDKIKFLNYFGLFVIRDYASLEELRNNSQKSVKMLADNSGRIVLKGSHGQIGAEVEVIKSSEYSPELIIDYMIKKKYDLAEQYVIQHQALMELSPAGLNTVRVFTQLHEGNVDFLGARLRVSVNSPVDNMAAGNLAAPIDLETGIVNGPGVYSDITKEDRTIHPITGKSISGFVIPHWEKVKELAVKAALHSKETKSVGWDIAIAEAGPELIEGNHNWCKNLWQLPVKRGMKSELEKYLIQSNW